MIDTIDIGSLTKKIRLSKKLSLKDVAGDYLSVSFLTGKKMNKKHIEVISDYLFDVDQWGKRELVILGNSMSAVPTNTLNLLIKEIIYKTTLFGNNEENKKIKIDLILNGISIFLERKELNYAKFYIDLFDTLTIPEVYLYERVEYNILIGTYWILIGKIEVGKKKIELALESLKNLGAENLLLMRENEYEELLNSII